MAFELRTWGYTVAPWLPVRQFMATEEFQGRQDCDIYLQTPGRTGKSPNHWTLKNQRHFHLGSAARQRILEVESQIPWHLAKQTKSGLSGDDYVERRHRCKDMEGAALIARRWSRPGLDKAVPLPADLLEALESKSRSDFPMRISKRHRLYTACLSVAQSLRKQRRSVS